MHKYEDRNTHGLRELSGGIPFGWLRRDAASLAREFEVLEVFHKRNYPKGLGSWGGKSPTMRVTPKFNEIGMTINIGA